MRRAGLPLVGIGVAAWAVIPPYVGPTLATDARVEVIDHVVPAVVILSVSLAALAAGVRAAATAMFASGLVIALAGVWMVATHIPLLAQASMGEAPSVSALWHFAPGPVVLAFGAAQVLRSSSEADVDVAQEAPR